MHIIIYGLASDEDRAVWVPFYVWMALLFGMAIVVENSAG